MTALEKDSISFNALTSQIEREHELLRGRLKPGRKNFARSKQHMFLPAEGREHRAPATSGADHRGRAGSHRPNGGSPSGIPRDQISADYEYAGAYLNALVWHNDRDKTTAYQAASPTMQRLYAKCAEIRVLSAIGIVSSLRDWIIAARADGFDL